MAFRDIKMTTVRLLDTSGKNEVDAVKLETNTITITKQSKHEPKSTYKQSHRNYYLRNRGKILAREHQRYIENREYWKDYYERNKAKGKTNEPESINQSR